MDIYLTVIVIDDWSHKLLHYGYSVPSAAMLTKSLYWADRLADASGVYITMIGYLIKKLAFI